MILIDDLPCRVEQEFELALQQVRRVRSRDASEQRLEGAARARVFHGSRPVSPIHRLVSRRVHGRQGPELRLRSGWFSDRSATYLAAGRPVVTQDTGFGDFLPTGRGLFAFSAIDDVVEAVEAINADYASHSRAAADLAREYFDSDVVLSRLLEELGER